MTGHQPVPSRGLLPAARQPPLAQRPLPPPLRRLLPGQPAGRRHWALPVGSGVGGEGVGSADTCSVVVTVMGLRMCSAIMCEKGLLSNSAVCLRRQSEEISIIVIAWALDVPPPSFRIHFPLWNSDYQGFYYK